MSKKKKKANSRFQLLARVHWDEVGRHRSLRCNNEASGGGFSQQYCGDELH
jgi:hypothetical protein